MTIQPGLSDLVMYQGATFSERFIWQDENEDPINLTGYTARMMVRSSYESATPLLSLTDGDGITITPDDGIIDIQVDAADTAAIVAQVGVYDIELISPGGQVYRFMQGRFSIEREVTRG